MKVLKKRVDELENESGVVKQVSGIELGKGEKITDTDIVKAKQVIIYYTLTTSKYINSVIVSQKFSGTFVEVEGNDIIGYFIIYFGTGVLQSSTYTNEIIKIVGYDIVR